MVLQYSQCNSGTNRVNAKENVVIKLEKAVSSAIARRFGHSFIHCCPLQIQKCIK